MTADDDFIAPGEEAHKDYRIVATTVESVRHGWSCNFLIIPPDPKQQRRTGQAEGPFDSRKAAYLAGVAEAKRVIDDGGDEVANG